MNADSSPQLGSRLPSLTRLLDRVATSVPIGSVLEEVALLVEREIPAIRCGIWLANKELGVLEHGASPSMPVDYLPPGGIRIADGNGGCGTAAARRVPVIDEDIETIEHWAAILPVMRRHKIRACWSIPFFSEDNLVAGTISAFAADPLAPSSDQLTLLKDSAQLAGIVVDRHRDVQRIRNSAQQYLQLAAVSPDGVFVHIDGCMLYANEAGLKLFGLDPGKDVRGRKLSTIFDTQSAVELQRINAGRVNLKRAGPAGIMVELEAEVAPIRFDAMDASLLVCRDISSRVSPDLALIRSMERTQSRISSELHERIGQQLVGISFLLASAGAKISSDDAALKKELNEINQLVRDSIAEVRLLADVNAPRSPR